MLACPLSVCLSYCNLSSDDDTDGGQGMHQQMKRSAKALQADAPMWDNAGAKVAWLRSRWADESTDRCMNVIEAIETNPLQWNRRSTLAYKGRDAKQ